MEYTLRTARPVFYIRWHHRPNYASMNRFINSLLLLCLIIMPLKSRGAFTEPDFAYPQQVCGDARALLGNAETMEGDSASATRLRALLELTVASSSVDPDSIFAMPALIAAQAAKTNNSTAGRAMLMALQASVLDKIYSGDRWKYEQTDAPALPYPQSVAEWGAVHFRNRSAELMDSALALCASGDAPLTDFDGCVSAGEATRAYVATAGMFIRTLAVESARMFNNDSRADSLIAVATAVAPAGSNTAIYWLWLRDRNNHSALLDDYRANASAEGARLLLTDMSYTAFGAEEAVEPEFYGSTTSSDNDNGNAARLKLVRLLEESLRRFPAWPGNDALEARLAHLKVPTVDIRLPRTTAPGRTVDIKVDHWFADSIAVDLYSVPDNYSFESVRTLTRTLPRLLTLTLLPDSVCGTTVLQLPAQQAGEYVLVPRLNGLEPDDYARLTVVPFVPFTVGCVNGSYAVTADYITGEPVRGVGVSLVKRDFRSGIASTDRLGNTDRKGMLPFDIPQARRAQQSLSFSYGGHTYTFDNSLRLWHQDAPQAATRRNALFMTDRALYHPGDSLQWALAAYTAMGDSGSVLAGARLEIVLRDANNNVVNSISVTADSHGRCHGSFDIPIDRLTGNYSLTAQYDGRTIGYAGITVSDFRLPTVFIDKTSVLRDTPAAGAVTVKGSVYTYSGMPVAGARVHINISRAQRWWCYFAPVATLGQVEGTTDTDGSFCIEVPAQMLAANDSAMPFYIAEINVTTANAETASATRNFTTGKPLNIDARFPSVADGAKAATATVHAFDADGADSAVSVLWQLGKLRSATEMADVVMHGTVTAGTTFALDLGNVPAGRYDLLLTPADSILADPTAVHNAITVYNTAANLVPDTGEPLFVPVTAPERSGNTATVLVGTSLEQATAYIAVRCGNNLKSLRPYTLRRGFHNISLELEGNEEAQIMITAVRNGQTFRNDLSVPAPSKPTMTISAESFRDRLVPGSGERWRLRISVGDSPAADAAMVATMFNGALEALEAYRMPAPISLHTPTASLIYNYLNYGYGYARMSGSTDYRFPEPWQWPRWRYLQQMRRVVYDMMLARSSAAVTSAGGMNKFAATDAAVEEVENEAVMEEAAADVAMDAAPGEVAAEAAAGEEQQQPELMYRTSEVLQAFFMPQLVSDADGGVDLVFTVPEANGRWALRTFAWTDALGSATYSAEATASKPVMVMPNLPRFLRQGDTAAIGATVLNNTDSIAEVTTTVEIFDTESNTVLHSEHFSDTIGAKGSAIVSVRVTAPEDRAAIGYRVRSVAGNYADGEQSAIPVLESGATVVESTQFYLNPTQQPLTLDIDVHPNTTYTLQYVSNPIWTVVKAMRGLGSGTAKTSTSLAGQLFSTISAGTIADACPNIAEAYRQWAANPQDGALTSMLARNSELKTLLLDQTPWVQAAASQSDRMAQLGRIFDRPQVTAALHAQTKALLELQNADGGFTWGGWCTQSSEWATRTVLMTLGLANSLDMPLGEELTDAARRAFGYLQHEVTKPNRADRDIEFALICTLFPDFECGTAAANVRNASVDYLARNWRSLGTTDKAYAILILKGNGRNAAADNVYRSLRQFAVERPGQGLCFPSVDDVRGYATIIQAFAAMDAPTATLDAMRQWITVRAQATDNLGAHNPDYVIAAVMLTGSDWTSAPLAFGLTVNGAPLDSDALQRATGYTVSRISPSGNRLTVEIRPNGATPSYGSVTSTGIRRQDTVEPQGSRGLMLHKRFLVQRDGQWVETQSFELGERVRVQFTLTVGRDMQYVALTDNRSATLEPCEQLPGFIYDGSVAFYRENGDTQTRLFIDWLPAGTYHITYDATANNSGEFISGVATLQSQYAPELTAHSGGCQISVR